MSAKVRKQLAPSQEKPVQDTDKEVKESEKVGKLREKVFVARESPFTVLYRDGNIQALYNVFLAVLVIQFLHSLAQSLLSGRMDFGQDFIMWNFGKLSVALPLWLSMVVSTLGVYVCFRCWAARSLMFAPSSLPLRCWDYGWLGALLVYQMTFVLIPGVLVLKLSLPPATAITILCEQVRMVMKTHAFVRSNAPRVLSGKPGDASGWPGPGFSHYLYFLFCPTLVYRDTYPRTKEIRWGVVGKHLLEVLAVIFYHCYILQRWIQPLFRDFGLRPWSLHRTVELVFGTALPAILADVSGIYCFLHAWSNAAAELMRFADRMFYQDWWTAPSYSVYFRKWNLVIHDWLYAYVYRDIHEALGPAGRTLPTMGVFVVSAVVHEYILALAFGFFYPLLFGLFIGAGATLTFLPSFKGGNMLFLLFQILGCGIFTSLYSMEVFARVNCVQTQVGWQDFVTPRSWSCSPVAVTTQS